MASKEPALPARMIGFDCEARIGGICNRMYNTRLARRILEKLEEAFPRRIDLNGLQAMLPTYQGLAGSEWLLSLQALADEGALSGKFLRKGTFIDAAAGLYITERGRARLKENADGELRDSSDASAMSTKGATSTSSFNEWAGGQRVMLAIVFTDVIGSTALAEELRDEAMNEVRRAHFAQSRELIVRYQGYEIKTIGDSFMAAFRSADDALDYSRALQENSGHTKVRVRAGIHVGSMQVEEDDVFGGTVNFASRVVGVITDAEIWLSDPAKMAIDQHGAARHKGLVWEQHQNVNMKGFPGGFTLWSIKRGAEAPQSTADEKRKSSAPEIVPRCPLAEAPTERCGYGKRFTCSNGGEIGCLGIQGVYVGGVEADFNQICEDVQVLVALSNRSYQTIRFPALWMEKNRGIWVGAESATIESLGPSKPVAIVLRSADKFYAATKWPSAPRLQPEIAEGRWLVKIMVRSESREDSFHFVVRLQAGAIATWEVSET